MLKSEIEVFKELSSYRDIAAEAERLREVTDEQYELAHLQLQRNPVGLYNPLLDDLTEYDVLHPDEHILSIMMNPDYFGWTCSKLFNTTISPNGLELLPMQCAILKELWYRPFPILLGSRGLSKSFMLALYALLRAAFIPGRKIIITGAGFRQSKLVLLYAEQIWDNSPVFRELCGKGRTQGAHHDSDVWWMQVGESIIKAIPIGDGCLGKMSNIAKEDCFSTIEFPVASIWGNGKYRDSNEHYVNGIKPTKKIITKKGFSYEGTYNHAMKVCRDGKVDWVRSDEMVVGDKILIDRSYRWHNGNSDISENDAYVLGCLVGDGSYTTDDILRFATKDKEFIEKIDNFLAKYFSSSQKMKWAGEKDDCHYTCYTAGICRDICKMFGMIGRKTIDKSFPKEILKAERNKVACFISGLFDTDGTLQVNTAKGGTGVTVSFTNTSEILVDQLQFILLHYGIISTKSHRDRDIKWNRVYELYIHGPNVVKFHKEIGFKLKRKAHLLEAGLNAKSRNYGNGDFVPDIQADMVSIANSVRIKRNSVKDSGVTASKLQQRKGVTYELAQRFLDVYSFTNDLRLQRIKDLADPNIFYDEIVSIENGKAETFDIHVPEGNEYCANGFFSHNSKIRGQRAHDIIGEEFASIDPQIFEEVIAGFGVVNIDPISQVKHYQRLEYLKKMGKLPDDQSIDDTNIVMANQLILSGTASFAFNHFYKYWKRYKNIILTRGNAKRMEKLGIDPKTDYKKYSIIRIPVDLLPRGFMDQAQIDRSQATMSSGIFVNEFMACFTDDSTGFFKRSMIDRAMPTYHSPVMIPATGTVVERFPALLRGYPDRKYVMSIDTASQRDNFAIVILEIHPDHARVAHVWTTKASDHLALQEAGFADKETFGAFCVKKIRSFIKNFNIVHISMDAQGGGRQVYDLLHDVNYLEPGDIPLWEIDRRNPLWDGKDRSTDGENGRHIVELVEFSNYKYISDANHNMKNDFEQLQLIFPYSDDIEYVIAGRSDYEEDRKIDSLERVMTEIDALKDELAMIQHDQADSKREKWFVPKTKGSQASSDLHDDRYAALLMANYAARRIRALPDTPVGYPTGGFVGSISSDKPALRDNEPLYTGPSWATNPLSKLSVGYGLVKRE